MFSYHSPGPITVTQLVDISLIPKLDCAIKKLLDIEFFLDCRLFRMIVFSEVQLSECD